MNTEARQDEVFLKSVSTYQSAPCSTEPIGKDRHPIFPGDEGVGDGSVGEAGGNSIPQDS